VGHGRGGNILQMAIKIRKIIFPRVYLFFVKKLQWKKTFLIWKRKKSRKNMKNELWKSQWNRTGKEPYNLDLSDKRFLFGKNFGFVSVKILIFGPKCWLSFGRNLAFFSKKIYFCNFYMEIYCFNGLQKWLFKIRCFETKLEIYF